MKASVRRRPTKPGSRRRLKQASYEIRVPLGTDESGKRLYHYETFNGTKGEADARAAELTVQLNRGELKLPSKIPLARYLDIWLTTSLPGTVAPRTLADYKEVTDRYIRPAIGEIMLTDLSPVHIDKLYADMRERGLSGRTRRGVHHVLSRALGRAHRYGMVSRNVARLVDTPKIEKRTMRSFTPEQAMEFLTAARSDRHYAMWLLALDSGMRPEEYLGLKWMDVDLTKGVVAVQRALCWNRKGGGYYFSELKTDGSRRSINLSKTTAEALREHRIDQQSERLRMGERWKGLDLIFTTQAGGPLLLSNLHRKHFKPILERAKLSKEFRLYDLRHTCATLLFDKDVHPKIVSARLGHSSIKLTLDVYSHVLPNMQERASNALEESVFSRLKP